MKISQAKKHENVTHGQRKVVSRNWPQGSLEVGFTK